MKVRASFLSTVAVLAFLCVPVHSVEAQSSNAVNSARIEILERKIRALQARLGMNPTPPAETSTTTTSLSDRRLVADLSAKIGGLERQMRQLNGRLEEYEYKQRQLEESLEMLRKELRLQREDLLAASRQQTEATGEAPVKPVEARNKPAEVEKEVVALPDGDASTQYKYAFSFIQKNDLESGKQAMVQFIEKNAGDSRIGNAKYWLGRIYLQQGSNGLAAQQFFSLIEDHPNHDKRTDALVDLADVLVKLDSAGDACNALAEFRRVEEKASNRLKRRAEQIHKAAECG